MVSRQGNRMRILFLTKGTKKTKELERKSLKLFFSLIFFVFFVPFM